MSDYITRLLRGERDGVERMLDVGEPSIAANLLYELSQLNAEIARRIPVQPEAQLAESCYRVIGQAFWCEGVDRLIFASSPEQAEKEAIGHHWEPISDLSLSEVCINSVELA